MLTLRLLGLVQLATRGEKEARQAKAARTSTNASSRTADQPAERRIEKTRITTKDTVTVRTRSPVKTRTDPHIPARDWERERDHERTHAGSRAGANSSAGLRQDKEGRLWLVLAQRTSTDG